MAGTGNTVERQCGTELTTLPAGTSTTTVVLLYVSLYS